MPMREPRPASYFRLTLGGKESVGVFKEASGFDSETEVITHKSIDANGRPYTRNVAGGLKWSNITLKRGVDESLDIWKWREQVIQEGPDKSRTNGSVALIDYSGSTIATWTFDQGWPIKYTGATLNAGGNEVAVEEIQICHEGLKRM